MFLIEAVVQEMDLRALQERGVITQALVLAESDGRNSYLDVRFTTTDGEVIETETGDYVEPVEPDDKIQIIYDPQDPTYTLQHVKWGFGRGLVFLAAVLGLLMLGLGLYIAVRGVPAWMERE